MPQSSDQLPFDSLAQLVVAKQGDVATASLVGVPGQRTGRARPDESCAEHLGSTYDFTSPSGTTPSSRPGSEDLTSQWRVSVLVCLLVKEGSWPVFLHFSRTARQSRHRGQQARSSCSRFNSHWSNADNGYSVKLGRRAGERTIRSSMSGRASGRRP